MKLRYLCLLLVGFVSYGYSQVNPNLRLNNKNVNNVNSSIISSTTLPNSTSLTNGNHTCKTYELNQRHYQERGIQNQFNQEYQFNAQNVHLMPINKTSGVNEISVIFHVVHAAGDALGTGTNVSNADIMAVYNDLVEDFQLLNLDAANARPQFTPADANINFCLATQDPLGTPLTEVGVIRVATNEDWYDSDNGEENKMKASATGGSQIWDRNNYLNVWICDISNGAGSGTAGYAYRPSPSYLPTASIDGIVLDYNLGVNNDNVLTHEVGHYLGLDHTWGGSGGCGNDDGFADTPETAGPSFDYPGSCSGSQQTCGATETQYENYMDYANCTVMFTQEQADYMLSILQGIRGSLLLSPGCDPVDAPPVVDFVADQTIIPVGGTVNFTSITTNAPTSWTWDFGGGAPNVTTENASATFNTVGFYTITHSATNAFGSNQEVKTNYIEVVAAATGTACDTLRNYDPAADWFIIGDATGYVHGNEYINDGTVDQPVNSWAEQYTAALTTEVRRLEFVPAVVNDGGGSITFNVYQDAAGEPGTVIASTTVPLADINELAWNAVDFAAPSPSVTGNFWVGYDVSYVNAADTFALLGEYNTPLTPNNFTFLDIGPYGWFEVSDIYTDQTTGNPLSTAFIMDVLTSNGPDPVANATYSEIAVCPGGDITVNGSGSLNTTNYYWYVTDDPITTIYDAAFVAGTTFNFPNPGNELITLFADGSCRTNTTNQAITIYDPVSATVTASNTTCGQNDGEITIASPAGGDLTNYEYSMDGNNYNAFTGSVTVSNLPSGNYTVYVRTNGDACETSYNVTVGASSDIAATVSPNQYVCNGALVTISASGGTSYTWSDGITTVGSTQSIQVSPSVTTQYSCIVTDVSGCSAIVFTTVGVDSGPALTNTAINPATCGSTTGSIDVQGSATGDLSWSGPVSNSLTAITLPYNITGLSAGVYTITFTDANGCSQMEVTLSDPNSPAVPTITPNGATTFCQGQSVDLTSSYTGGNLWSSNETTDVITVDQAGTYTVTYTDGSGCSSTSAPITISVTPGPTAPTITPSGPLSFCDGDDVQLTSSYSSGILWSTGETTQTITVSSSQNVTVTYTNGSGCSTESNPTTVTVNQLPTAPTISAGGATTFCDGGSVTLTSSENSGNLWSDNSTTQDITVSASGSYTVTYTDGNGCASTSAATDVTVNPLPTVTMSPIAQVCVYDAAFALTGGSPSGGTYSGTGVTTNQFDPNTAGTGTHTITYNYTDGNGCSNDATTDIVVDACLGLEEITTEINVYPNPANDHLIIELDGEFNYTITDARGRVVSEGYANNATTVDVQSFEYGVYFVNVHANEKSSTIRVVKQ